MNKLNRKVEYALMALKFMSSKVPGELTSTKEVVESTGCPFDATARVMQQMAQKIFFARNKDLKVAISLSVISLKHLFTN